MEKETNQVTNLETMAGRYVLLTMSYNKLKDPHLTNEERRVFESQIHRLLDLDHEEFTIIRDLVTGHVQGLDSTADG
jgi:hypothetical protein